MNEMNEMKKVPSLYVASATRQSVGKTALCLGLALLFREEGLKVGYYKPVGWRTKTLKGQPIDEDTLLMKETLKLEEPLELLAPILLEYHYLDQYSPEDSPELLKKVKDAYREVSEGKDILIIESLHEPSLGESLNLSAADLAKAFGSYLLLLSSTPQDIAVDEILFESSCISGKGLGCCGVVFSRVREPIDRRIKERVIPAIERHGIRVWGVIPESTALTAPTVGEVAETLGGEVLCGEDFLSKPVENYLVGAMTPEAALRYFRRAKRKAVVTGGDRPDIALAALETDTSAVILTGNIHPDVRVLAKAEEKGVPIILVPYDTYTTVNKVRDITGKITVGDVKRINEAKRIAAEYVDWRGLLSMIGVKRT